MTCDVEFLAEVNAALKDARFEWLGVNVFEGWLEFSREPHRYRIGWSGWLSATPRTTFLDKAKGYEFAPIIGPLIGEHLVAITRREGVYELAFANGQSVFAGHFGEVNGTDHVLMVESLNSDAPFTWGLLD